MASGRIIDISSGTILRVALFCLLFFTLFLIRDVLLMLVASVIIACAIEPLAKKLQTYHVPRGVSVVTVYLLFIGFIAVAVTLILPVLARQTTQLAQQAPEIVSGLEEYLGNIPGFSSQHVVPQLQQTLDNLGNNFANISSQIFQQTKSIFSGFFSLLFVFIIAFYLIIEENALKKIFRFIIPKQHMAYVELMIDRIQGKLGRWVLAQLVLGIVVGLAIGIIFWILGFEYAVTLGLIAGILEVFPVVGPILSGVFGTVLALSHSLVFGLIALFVYVVVQQLENQFLVPSIMKRAVGLNPVVTIIAVLLGGRLAGVTGVILAVPIATICSIILGDFFSTAAGDDELAG